MITNVAPRPWYPGNPVQLVCNSKDSFPTAWEGKTIANGSTIHVMDEDKSYMFDEEDRTWYEYTGPGSGGGGGGGDEQHVATDDEADEALDTLWPN